MTCDSCCGRTDDLIVIYSPQGHRYYCDACAKRKKVGPYDT